MLFYFQTLRTSSGRRLFINFLNVSCSTADNDLWQTVIIFWQFCYIYYIAHIKLTANTSEQRLFHLIFSMIFFTLWRLLISCLENVALPIRCSCTVTIISIDPTYLKVKIDVYRYIMVEIYRRQRATNYRQVKAQSVMYRYTHPYWDRSVPQWALTDFYSKAGFFNKVDEKHAGASSMANRAIYPITVRDTGGRWINKKAIYKLSQRFIRVIPLINSRYCRRAFL